MDNHTHERKYDVNDAKGFLAGVLLGGLAGAATMLLLAPQSGAATRAKIQQKTIELRDQTTAAVGAATAQVRVKARQVTTGIHDKAEEVQEYAQEMLDGQRERWSPVGEAAKTAFQGSQD